MYMFLQGRLWQGTGGSSPLGGPRRGLESHIFVYLLPPPFLPLSPRTSSALPPSVCTHTPIPWGNSELTFAIFPTPLEEGAGISQALSLVIVCPSGPDQKEAALCRESPRRCQLIISLLFTP